MVILPETFALIVSISFTKKVFGFAIIPITVNKRRGLKARRVKKTVAERL
jgi:hypothetical protein